jgi:hypothetical protein
MDLFLNFLKSSEIKKVINNDIYIEMMMWFYK